MTHEALRRASGELPRSRSVDRSVHEILEEWRAAERELEEAAPGSGEAMDALVRVRDLRAEYQRAFEDALGAAAH